MSHFAARFNNAAALSPKTRTHSKAVEYKLPPLEGRFLRSAVVMGALVLAVGGIVAAFLHYAGVGW